MTQPPIQRSNTPPPNETHPPQAREMHYDAFLRRCEQQLNNYSERFALGDPKDRCRAAFREDRGEVVSVKHDGTPHDHVRKVKNVQRGLKENAANLQDLLRDPSASRQQRMQAERLLSRASKLLDYSERFVQSEPRKNLSYAARQAAKFAKMGLAGAAFMSSTLFGKTPANQQFRQILQQTKLTESYKSSNPNSTIGPKGGSNGQIGGVGNTTGMIKGLFDSPESIFETEHYFMVPLVQPTDKSQPHLEQSPVFSKEELQQIIRELAIGIYAHDTVPFFSLEFNQEGHLFPVIHPVYQNTLVGRVIGMLDYVMKGYLNGGVFNDAFVDSWSDSQKWSRSSALDQMIIFQDYVKKECPKSYYLPLKIMIDRSLHSEKMSLEKEVRVALKGASAETREQKVKQALEEANPSFFEDHTKFSNSFRIIAKQNSFNKKENLSRL